MIYLIWRFPVRFLEHSINPWWEWQRCTDRIFIHRIKTGNTFWLFTFVDHYFQLQISSIIASSYILTEYTWRKIPGPGILFWKVNWIIWWIPSSKPLLMQNIKHVNMCTKVSGKKGKIFNILGLTNFFNWLYKYADSRITEKQAGAE